MKITDKHESHGFYDVWRYPPSQPRPHCAFPWLLDKLRWTKVIVTDVSHYFGPKYGWGFENRTAQLHQEFSGVPPGKLEAQ